MSSLRKDPITNQDKQIMRINKYQFLIPNILTFLPGYKRLLNEENDDNPENTDTSQYEKGYMSHTRWYDYIAKVKDTKNTNYDYECIKDTSKLQDGNERVYNLEKFRYFA